MLNDHFSDEQWAFMAVFEAFGGPLPVEIAGMFVPLSDGQLLDVIERGTDLIVPAGEDAFSFSPNAPHDALQKLNEINTKEHLQQMILQLEKLGLGEKIDKTALIRVLKRVGRVTEAARLACEVARTMDSGGDPETVRLQLMHIQADLAESLENPENAKLFIEIVLDISRLSIRLEKFDPDVSKILRQARFCAEQNGDRRSWAVINLYLGRYYMLHDRLEDALSIMQAANQEVENLGDDDILTRTAESRAFFYYLQGLHRNVANTLENAVGVSDSLDKCFLDPLTPIFYATSLAFTGRHHQAIGMLSVASRDAEHSGKTSLAVHYRSVLGVVLLMMGRNREAEGQLKEASGDALNAKNLIAYSIAEIALAYAELRNNLVCESYSHMNGCMRRLVIAGVMPRDYPANFLLEMLLAFHQQGFNPLPFFDLSGEISRLSVGPNVHLKGVALRLSAVQGRKDAARCMRDLIESENCLKRSGDRVELAKTHAEMARLTLQTGDQAKARELALAAWDGLAGLNLFPDDLTCLLEATVLENDSFTDRAGQLFEMIEKILIDREAVDIFGLILDATSRFFRSERAGLFWFTDKPDKAPILRCGKNLTGKDILENGFRNQLTLIYKSLHENRAQRIRSTSMAALCIPVEAGGSVRIVFYYANACLEDGFDFLDDHLLLRLQRTLSSCMERIIADEPRYEKRGRDRSEITSADIKNGQDDILTRNERMLRELARLDQIAGSDTTVLIAGETGAGKGLFAHRIHRHSPRAGGPFIEVDLALIPENLIESELFGHEKGASAAAGEQRTGKIELTDKGTLFINEPGKMSKSVQEKLLKTLQEKKVVRLGGSHPIETDFRLLAATSRNLAQEVEKGRFRQDLYHRINVVHIEVPPLRERGGDVVLIARYLLDKAAQKFSRSVPVLSAEHERALLSYHWPGNVRELKNVIERAVLLSTGDRIELMLSAGTPASTESPFDDGPSIDEIQRRYIQHVLQITGGRISGPGGAAEILGLPRTTLNARIKKLGLR
jgi:transcriptional regulator with GAF, ATPase, and Fis domain/tetratricopeptide (TPR) repeat protein